MTPQGMKPQGGLLQNKTSRRVRPPSLRTHPSRGLSCIHGAAPGSLNDRQEPRSWKQPLPLPSHTSSLQSSASNFWVHANYRTGHPALQSTEMSSRVKSVSVREAAGTHETETEHGVQCHPNPIFPPLVSPFNPSYSTTAGSEVCASKSNTDLRTGGRSRCRLPAGTTGPAHHLLRLAVKKVATSLQRQVRNCQGRSRVCGSISCDPRPGVGLQPRAGSVSAVQGGA